MCGKFSVTKDAVSFKENFKNKGRDTGKPISTCKIYRTMCRSYWNLFKLIQNYKSMGQSEL